MLHYLTMKVEPQQAAEELSRAVILSEAKDLALLALRKLREGSDEMDLRLRGG